MQTSKLLLDLEAHRKTKDLTDVELKIGDQHFSAHSLILSVASPVLKALLSELWALTAQHPMSSTRVLELNESVVDPTIMDELLTYIYTESIAITGENAFALCVASNHLQLTDLSSICTQLLSDLISPANVLDLLQATTDRKLSFLQQRCCQFITQYHESFETFDTKQFYNLSYPAFESFIIALKNDVESCSLTDCLFYCVIRWVKRHLARRKVYLSHLLSLLPLSELSPANIQFVHEFVPGFAHIELVAGVPQVVQLGDAEIVLIKKEKEPRIFLIGGQASKDRTILPTMECFNPLTGEAADLPPMSCPRYDAAATVIDNKIYVMGGKTYDHVHTATVEAFDCDTHSWEKLAPLPVAVEEVTSIYFQDSLYVSGFQRPEPNAEDRFNRTLVYKYCTTSGAWESLGNAAIRRGINEYRFLALDNCLYLMANPAAKYSNVYKYDHETNRWSMMIKKKWLKEMDSTLQYRRELFNTFDEITVYPAADNYSCVLPTSKKGSASVGRSVMFCNRRLALSIDGNAQGLVVGDNYRCKVYEDVGKYRWPEVGYWPANRDRCAIVVAEIDE